MMYHIDYKRHDVGQIMGLDEGVSGINLSVLPSTFS